VTVSADDRVAIAELLARHGHLFDDGELDRLDLLFTASVSYDVTAFGGGVLRGIEAIRSAALDVGDRNPVGHHVTNVVGAPPMWVAWSLLPDACQNDDPCRQLVVDEIWRALRVIEDADLIGEFDRVQAQIAPWIAMDPRRPYSDDAVSAGQTAMRAFIAGRRTYLEGAIAPPSE